MYQILPGNGSILCVGLHHTIYRTRHTRGEMARQTAVSNRMAGGIQIHIPKGFRGRRLPKIECVCGAICSTQHHKPAATDVSGAWKHNCESEVSGNRCIHGIAAALQYFLAYLGCQWVRTNNGCRIHHQAGYALALPARQHYRTKKNKQQTIHEIIVGFPSVNVLFEGQSCT